MFKVVRNVLILNETRIYAAPAVKGLKYNNGPVHSTQQRRDADQYCRTKPEKAVSAYL